VFAGLVLGLGLSVLAADKVAVLTLDGKIPDLSTARDNFALAVQASVGLPVQLGDSLSSLELLLGCSRTESGCLGRIAESLGVRYLLHGEVETKGKGIRIKAVLFDTNTPVAIAEGSLSSPADRDGVQKVVDFLLASEAAAPLRRQVQVVTVKERSPLRFLIPVGLGVSGGALLASALFIRDELNEGNIKDPGEADELRARGQAFLIGSIASFGAAGGALVVVAVPWDRLRKADKADKADNEPSTINERGSP
jgi:hypothetical protein